MLGLASATTTSLQNSCQMHGSNQNGHLWRISMLPTKQKRRRVSCPPWIQGYANVANSSVFCHFQERRWRKNNNGRSSTNETENERWSFLQRQSRHNTSFIRMLCPSSRLASSLHCIVAGPFFPPSEQLKMILWLLAKQTSGVHPSWRWQISAGLSSLNPLKGPWISISDLSSGFSLRHRTTSKCLFC